MPKPNTVSLLKLVQSQGFGSKKKCLSLIHDGQVRIEGQCLVNPNHLVDTHELNFEIHGQTWQYRKHVYLALHKPKGFECSHNPSHHRSIYELLPPQLRDRGVQCAGRLDQDTTGLILLSDDGQFVHSHTHPKKQVEKHYIVEVDQPLTQTAINQLLSGVSLSVNHQSILVAATHCEQIGEQQLRLVITQGIYHQIKRMLASVGYQVTALHRSQIGVLTIKSLQEGQWCYLDGHPLVLAQQTTVASLHTR